MDARLLLRRSNHTHSEVEGFESRGADASLTMHRHTRALLDVKARAYMHANTHKLQPCGRLSNRTHPTGLRSNQQD